MPSAETISQAHAICGYTPGRLKHHFCSDASVAAAENFVPRKGDVYITTMGKTGTTWLQMICHQLRCPGDIDFDEITEVCPWLETMGDTGQDMNGDQRGSPRCFKTHARMSCLPDPNGEAKFICTIRDPQKALASMFRFMWTKGRLGDITDINQWAAMNAEESEAAGLAKSMAFDAMVKKTMGGFLEYVQCRHAPPVLLLCFEEMQAELESTILKVAQHMELAEPSKETLATVCGLCSYEWMSANHHLFNDNYLLSKVGKQGMISSKVGLETPNLNAKLNEATIAKLDAVWRETITASIGFEDYDSLRAALSAEQDGQCAN